MKRAPQPQTSPLEQPQGDSDAVGALPEVLFLDDVARVLRTSRRTIAAMRRHRCFPIPELPTIDKRPRWSRVAVEQFLAGEYAWTKSCCFCAKLSVAF
jgi:hypothetical protein